MAEEDMNGISLEETMGENEVVLPTLARDAARGVTKALDKQAKRRNERSVKETDRAILRWVGDSFAGWYCSVNERRSKRYRRDAMEQQR